MPNSSSETQRVRMDALDHEFYQLATRMELRKFFKWLQASYGSSDIVQMIRRDQWTDNEGGFRLDRMSTLEADIRSLREFTPETDFDKAYEATIFNKNKPELVVDSAWFIRREDAGRWISGRTEFDEDVRGKIKAAWIRGNYNRSAQPPSDEDVENDEPEPEEVG